MQALKQRWDKFLEQFDILFDDYQPPDSFQLRHDIEDLRILSSLSEFPDPLLTFFSQLSHYFEIGFLYTKEPDRQSSRFWPRALFANGQCFVVNRDDSESVKLPAAKVFQSKSLRGDLFLKRLNFSRSHLFKDFTAIYIKISETESLCFVTKTAEPWLQERVEVLTETLKRIVCESKNI